MNNKGFTLIELLATIVILSVLGVIAYTAVSGYVKTSKEKAEEKFLDEISTEIEAYLELYGTTNFVQGGDSLTFTKDINGGGSYSVTVWKLNLNGGSNFTLDTIIKSDLGMNKGEFKNPRTGEVCSPSDVVIDVYKDSDYVYYYYVNMTDTSIGCTALEDIDTRPDDLRCKLGIIEACSDEG